MNKKPITKNAGERIVSFLKGNERTRYGTRLHLVALAVTLLVGALSYYLVLPPLNIFSTAFWWFLFWLALVYTGTLFGVRGILRFKNGTAGELPQKPGGMLRSFFGGATRIGLALMAIPVLVLLLGSMFSSTFFHARAYAGVIDVTEATFRDDMPESDSVTNIALMDGASAVIVGNKKLGELSHVVSQYEVSTHYTQINYHGVPRKVANLEHADFFKWFNNRDKGIPGYVMVDPVNATADYVEFSDPIRYVDSAFFGDDLQRKLRFSYPTKIFGSTRFEVDESGNPRYIVACMAPKVGLFGAMDVSEVIIFNPIDGSSEIYDVDETPSWIDAAFDGDLAVKKYDWFGKLSGGFWNSIIGNVDCKRATEDYGYIAIGDDIWYYTGVTSLTSDESNIGFMLCNARTGEYKYYRVAGADEAAAMGSAEGKLQHMGYRASFPALINVGGNATYIMVLKDNSGLVKSYALVNVEHYEIVATGDTQASAFAEYRKLLSASGAIESTGAEYTVTVERIADYVRDGETVFYFYASDGVVYAATLSDDEGLVLISEGDSVTFRAEETATEGIRRVVSYTKN